MVPGTHILINAKAQQEGLLLDVHAFEQFITQALVDFNLVQVGKVFHSFEGGGFTGVVCLTESHLAIHTWPEFECYTCDIYLCDYTRNNYTLSLQLAEALKAYFKSYDIKEQIIER